MRTIFITILLFPISFFAQVGINTDAPKVTLEVKKNESISKADGIIPPQLTGNQLKAKDNLYTTDLEGTLVYITEVASPVSPKTVNVNSLGYYYFDGAKWVKFNTEINQNIYNSNGSLTSNRQVNLNNFNLEFTGSGNISTKFINSSGTSSATKSAIQIKDGGEGDNKVLMSDASGNARWDTPASIKPTVLGAREAGSPANVNSTGAVAPLYSYQKITLTAGKWVVNAGLTISNNSIAGYSNNYWHHAYISSSKTSSQTIGFNFLGPASTNTAYAGLLVSGNVFNFMNGSSIIEVTNPSVDIYLLIENKTANLWTYPTGAYENYFYAIPIN